MPLSMPNELQLREKKRNNLILFGLNDDNQEGKCDNDLVATLFNDLGIEINSWDSQIFRVGRENLDTPRPLIIKLRNHDSKAHILFKAKGLKNNEKWKGISITHDLTKLQCQEVKAREIELRNMADNKNSLLSEPEKACKIWRVVGGHANRHLKLTKF